MSVIGSKVSSQSPMFCTHWAGSVPLIRVRVNVTFLYGELYPAMSAFSWKYPLTSSMKSSALDWSLVKIWGRLPIAFTSAAGAMGCCGAAGCAPPGGPPPPPPGAPPLPEGPLPLPFAFCIAEAILCWGVGVAPKAEVVVVVAMMVCILINGCSLGSVLPVVMSRLVHTVGSIGVCLISWLMVASSSISGLSWLSSLLSVSSWLWSRFNNLLV